MKINGRISCYITLFVISTHQQKVIRIKKPWQQYPNQRQNTRNKLPSLPQFIVISNKK